MASLTNVCPSKDKKKNYFSAIKFSLKLAAINLDGDDSILYRCYSIFVIVFCTVCYTIFDFLEVFKHEFNVSVNSILRFLFPFIVATVKALVIFVKRKELGKLLDQLEQEPFIPNPKRGGEKEEKLIAECVWYTTLQARAYWIMLTVTISAAVIIAIIKRLGSDDYHDWILPLGPFTVLNITHSPNFEITFVCQTICASYLGLQFVSVDVVTAYALAHISYQFKMVQVNFRRILLISYENMQKAEPGSVRRWDRGSNSEGEIEGSAIQWKFLKDALKEAVEYHLAVLKLVDEMESVFSSLLLTTFLTTLGILCFMVYRASLVSFSDPNIVSAIVEPVDASFQVALVCYWGEQVMFQSQEVGSAAFDSSFTGTDVRFQKSLILIIRRSQNPSKLTAGKFSVVCLATFVWVMRASYSAFMMLKKSNV